MNTLPGQEKSNWESAAASNYSAFWVVGGIAADACWCRRATACSIAVLHHLLSIMIMNTIYNASHPPSVNLSKHSSCNLRPLKNTDSICIHESIITHHEIKSFVEVLAHLLIHSSFLPLVQTSPPERLRAIQGEMFLLMVRVQALLLGCSSLSCLEPP